MQKPQEFSTRWYPEIARTSTGGLRESRIMSEELLALIKENVTEEQAMRYGFITNIVKSLEMKGYGRRIRFKETPMLALPKEDVKTPDLESLPCYGILERRGLVAYAARA
jgi:hypothetical protein